MILTASFFTGSGVGTDFAYDATAGGEMSVNQSLTGTSIQTICNAIRRRTFNIQFNNTIELNSTIYFCRLNHR